MLHGAGLLTNIDPINDPVLYENIPYMEHMGSSMILQQLRLVQQLVAVRDSAHGYVRLDQSDPGHPRIQAAKRAV